VSRPGQLRCTSMKKQGVFTSARGRFPTPPAVAGGRRIEKRAERRSSQSACLVIGRRGVSGMVARNGNIFGGPHPRISLERGGLARGLPRWTEFKRCRCEPGFDFWLQFGIPGHKSAKIAPVSTPMNAAAHSSPDGPRAIRVAKPLNDQRPCPGQPR